MTEKTINDLRIEKLAQGGDGLSHLPDGRVVFVQGGFPGDVVDVAIDRQKKTWARGHVVRIKEPGSARQPAGCEAFERGCGGCQFWGVAYDGELQWKVDAAREAMARISKLELPEAQVVEAPDVRDYRSRVIYHQRRDKTELHRGFFEAGTRQVVDVEKCPVARPEIDGAIAELGGALGMLGRADITVETAGGGQAVILVELGKKERIRHDQLEEISRRVEQGTVVAGVEIVDYRGKYFIIGDTTVEAAEVLAYSPVASMRVKPGRFRQANGDVNRLMVDYVTGLITAGPVADPRVVELFCGAGNFSFPLAAHVQGLIGYEASEDAVEAAVQMAELAEDGGRLRFEVADLFDEEIVAAIGALDFDVMLLDPPREGAAEVSRQMAESAAADGAQQIVYVSCDPACLARDLKTLVGGGWSLGSLRFFDLFPRTHHLEVVASLTRG